MINRIPLKLGTIAIAILIFLAVIPNYIGDYYLDISIRALWFTFLSISWVIACRAGAINLCHTTFIGIGAYATMMLFYKADISPLLGMPVGIVLALITALLIGWVCFRAKLQLISFFLVTLAFSMIVRFIASSQSFLGSDVGFRVFARENDIWNLQWVTKVPYYYIILVMTLLVLVVYLLIDRSKLGIYFRAIADNERGAAAIGIDIMRYKLIALGISAMLGALAGTFWAQYSGSVTPNVYLSPNWMLQLLLFVCIGGMASRWGPVLLPLISIPVLDLSKKEIGAEYGGFVWIAFGAMLIMTMIIYPRGIMTWVEERFRDNKFKWPSFPFKRHRSEDTYLT